MEPDFWSCDQYDREAQRLYEHGEYEAAIELLREGLSLYPSSPELLVSVGFTRLAREEYAWARRAFETALVLEPDHEEALAGMGEVFLKLGERGRAFLLFERILDLGFSGDVDLMLCIGRILYRESLFQRAERFFRLAVLADVRCAEAALELAYTRHRRDDATGALRWSRQAAALEPVNHDIRTFLGNLLYETGELREALEVLEPIPVDELWDPVATWRLIELLRRFRGLSADAPEVQPYAERLLALTVEPSPEEQLLSEIEAQGDESLAGRNRSQLDLFGWIPPPASEGTHRVRVADGRVYEGDWISIVRAMRDGSADPSMSLDEFMMGEARRLHDLTGEMISWDDPRSFIAESARLGVLRIER